MNIRKFSDEGGVGIAFQQLPQSETERGIERKSEIKERERVERERRKVRGEREKS